MSVTDEGRWSGDAVESVEAGFVVDVVSPSAAGTRWKRRWL